MKRIVHSLKFISAGRLESSIQWRSSDIVDSKNKSKKSVNREPLTKNQKGQILVIGVIVLFVVMILTTALFARVASFLKSGANSVMRKQALMLAEAGVDKTVWQLNETKGDFTGETNTALGTLGTFTVTVTNKSSTLKTITATGYIPNATKPLAKRTVKVDAQISTDIVEFRYAVQVGTGGITMSNSSTINGNVYSNKTGTSIQGSNSSQIIGDAYAVGTISSPAPNVTGLKYQNQLPSQMPEFDNKMWKDAATAGGTTTCSGSNCTFTSGTSDIGPRKYIGNMSISNGAIVNVRGPIYITGNLTLSNNNTHVRLDNSFGSTGTVIVVDGNVSISNGASIDPTGASPPGYLLIASNSTSDSALSISNQGANALFYALSGGATLSNSAHMTALVAQSLTLSNSARLDYDSGLASAQFTTGPGGSWQLKKGTYRNTASP